jgi:MinD-like ATPase involved in chromosome partitioning or flagellar assembly
MSKIITVYGSGGSGKTTAALELVKALAAAEPHENVVLVGLDNTKPLIPVLFPGNADFAGLSLGKVLSEAKVTPEVILKNSAGVGSNVCVLGYNVDENARSFVKPTDSVLRGLWFTLRNMAKYVVVDGTDNIVAQSRTASALIASDEVLYLLGADINGIQFYRSQKPLLLTEAYKYSGFTRTLSVSEKFVADIEAVKNVIGKIEYVLPYSKQLPVMLNEGRAFEENPDRAYNAVVKQLAAKFAKEEEFSDE